MAIRVLVNGANGKMGSLAVEAIKKDTELLLVGQSDVHDDLRSKIKQHAAQVVVDLTAASFVYENTKAILESGARPVIGTSGLLEEQVLQLQEICKANSLGGIIAPNFSISVLLMQRFAKEAVKHFPQVEIIETHHAAKEDSPSGTAIRTAEIIAAGAKAELQSAPSKEILDSARGAEYKGINIHALRLPGRNAHQEVIFGGHGEILSIKSEVINRDAYMPGICLACKLVMPLDNLVYGLENLL